MQIAIAIITLVLCAGVLYWFKRSENQKRTRRTEEEEDERERLAQKTAQEFVNAKDLGEHCLYTIDGYIFAYIKIEGLCLELYRPTNHFRKSMLYPILQSRLHTRRLKERDLSALQSRAA